MTFTYLQAIITAIIQGITELFPVSSLGHAILIPAWIGGSFKDFISEENHSYLLITIAMHLASVIANNTCKMHRYGNQQVKIGRAHV